MRNGNLIVVAAALWLAGCVSIEPGVEERFGESVKAANRAQSIYPDGPPNREVAEGMDGAAAKEAMDRYINSFRAPPPTINVLNIGGAFTGQQ
jgi:hypothetical protein